MDFWFVCSTPVCRLLWLHHTVRRFVGICSSELYATFSMKVSCHAGIYFSNVGYIEEFIPYCLICDTLFFHLINIDA